MAPERRFSYVPPLFPDLPWMALWSHVCTKNPIAVGYVCSNIYQCTFIHSVEKRIPSLIFIIYICFFSLFLWSHGIQLKDWIHWTILLLAAC